MLKRIGVATIAFAFAAQVVVPVPRAEAIIGIILYSAKNHQVGLPLMIAGGVGILPGAPVAGLIAAAAYVPPTGAFVVGSAGLVGIGAGILVGLIGLVVLDSASQQDIVFGPVSDREARLLGMTDDEQAAYLHSLPQINAIRENVREDVLAAGLPTFKGVSAAWQGYAENLSPEAFSGLKKVSAGIRQSLK